MECSEALLRIVNFVLHVLFPTGFDVRLDVNNVGVRMKERRHTPHDFRRGGGGEGGDDIYNKVLKEGRKGKISASPPTTLP